MLEIHKTGLEDLSGNREPDLTKKPILILSDFVMDYTVRNIQSLIELLYQQLGTPLVFNDTNSKVKMKLQDLDIKKEAVDNQKELLLGDSSKGNLSKQVQNAGRPEKSTREK